MSTLRFFVILSLLFTLLFAVIIGLIHAQPYDHSQLQEFLMPPEGCLMPCFMGIRPGVTTVEEAVAILEVHEWVEQPHVLEATDGRGIYAITANWSGMQPGLIDSAEELWMGVEDDTIQTIVISTEVHLGDVWLLLGVPERRLITRFTGGFYASGIGYTALYSDYNLVFWIPELYCPIRSVWDGRVELQIGAYRYGVEYLNEYDLPNQSYAVCRRLMNAG